MNSKKIKQVILQNLEEEKSCFNELAVKLSKQKKAIEDQNEERVLQIIEEKSVLMEKFKKLEDEVEAHLELLSPEDIEDLAKEGKVLKESLERQLKSIIRLEEDCSDKLGFKMRSVEKKILGLQRGKKIGEGYGRYPKIKPLISKKI